MEGIWIFQGMDHLAVDGWTARNVPDIKDRNTSSSLLHVVTAVGTRSSAVRAWKSSLLQPYPSLSPFTPLQSHIQHIQRAM
jgi:hypothetical protein